mgnify:CR=1 FL=1
MPGGRPTEYKPEYCEKLIEHMADGLSYESFAGKLRVCRDTLYNWEKLFPEFSYSKKVGKEASLLKWETIGLDAVEGRIEKFSAPTYIFTMKNRFEWKDKTETENKTTVETSRLVINFDNDDKSE